MKMPGFNAQASFYKTVKQYPMAATAGWSFASHGIAAALFPIVFPPGPTTIYTECRGVDLFCTSPISIFVDQNSIPKNEYTLCSPNDVSCGGNPCAKLKGCALIVCDCEAHGGFWVPCDRPSACPPCGGKCT